MPLEDPEKRPRLPPLSALLSPLSQQERSPPHVSPASSSMTSMSEKRPWSPIHTSGSDPRSTSSSSNLGSRDIFYPKAFENETALSGRVSTFAHSATRLADKEIEEGNQTSALHHNRTKYLHRTSPPPQPSLRTLQTEGTLPSLPSPVTTKHRSPSFNGSRPELQQRSSYLSEGGPPYSQTSELPPLSIDSNIGPQRSSSFASLRRGWASSPYERPTSPGDLEAFNKVRGKAMCSGKALNSPSLALRIILVRQASE